MKIRTKKTVLQIFAIIMMMLIIVDLVFVGISLSVHFRHVNLSNRFNESDRYYMLSELSLLTTPVDDLLDYGLLISENLRSIGINLELKVEDSSIFLGKLNHTHDYDMFLISLNLSNLTEPLFWKIGEYINPVNLDLNIPYVNETSILLTNIDNESNTEIRNNLLIEWHNNVMDKLVYILPIFNVVEENYNRTIILGFNLKSQFIGGDNNYVYLTQPGKESYTKGIAIRKAICYNINREKIKQTINNPKIEVIDIIGISNEDYTNHSDVFHYIYDYAAAEEWLYSTGYDCCLNHSYYAYEYFWYAIIIFAINIFPMFGLILIRIRYTKIRNLEQL